MVWPRLRDLLAGGCVAALAALCCCERAAAAGQPAVTYNQQIAPLLKRNCVGCHHPGGTAPFSLQTLAEVQRWSQQILSATQTRYMPPWLPEPGYGDFADVHRLSDDDIAAIQRWIDSGMPPGTEAAPHVPVAGEWALGTPDLVLTGEAAAAADTIPASGVASGASVAPVQRWTMRNPSHRALHVRALELSFGGSQSVQEARIEVMGREKPAGGTDLWGGGPVFWTPNSPVAASAPTPLLLIPAGSNLRVTARLSAQGSAAASQVPAPKLALFAGAGAVNDPAVTVELSGDKKIDIPAGAKDFTVERELTLPVAVEVLSVYPQAHLLGRELQAYATLPGGQKRWLLWIRHWDVERAAVYTYRRPVPLPKGAVVHLRYTYDNSAENTHNPNDPPRAVAAGEAEGSEVAHLWLRLAGLPLPAGGVAPAEAARLLARAASSAR